MKQLFSTFAILLIAVLIKANAQHKSLASVNDFEYDATSNAATAAM